MSLSAVFLTQDQAIAIRTRHFPHSRALELKHQSLVKRPSYYQPLLAAQQECLEHYKGVTYIVDKRYMCVLKLIDDCIEPVMHSMGEDLYQNGENLALASLMYTTGDVFWAEGSLDRLLHLYQDASHIKSEKAIREFSQFALNLQGRDVAEYLAPIAFMHPECLRSLVSSHTSTNIALSLLSGLVIKLEQLAEGQYTVVHDRSDSMRRYHKLLEGMCNDREPAQYRISDICKISYPLKLSGVQEGDSKEQCGIQLADLLAGGVIAGARGLARLDPPNDYNTSVISLYSDENLIYMMPDTDFEGVVRRFSNNQIAAAIESFSRKTMDNG
ncbi:MAG: hypothetical protein R3B95_20750 [Nitrospirales bacterium]|nr:hypothetical protein [Nitrospirales bacterium]